MTEPALEPTLAFLQRLWRLNHAIERLSMRMDRSLGVTTQQRLLLRCIGRTPNATAGQLAKLLHVDPALRPPGAAALLPAVDRTYDPGNGIARACPAIRGRIASGGIDSSAATVWRRACMRC